MTGIQRLHLFFDSVGSKKQIQKEVKLKVKFGAKFKCLLRDILHVYSHLTLYIGWMYVFILN